MMRELLKTSTLRIVGFRTDVPPTLESKMRSVLTEAERDRADRFKFERDRRSFTVTRAALRSILAQYINVPPGSLRLEHNAYGKPGLISGSQDLHFNVSHSSDYAIIAVSAVCSVGVDVERVRNNISERDIAKSFFSPTEIEWLNSCSSETYLKNFYRLWVIKEAFAKCIGFGLAAPLRDLEVEFDDSSKRAGDYQ